MFLYLRWKLEAVLKFNSVVGLFIGIVYLITGNWILSITSLSTALLFNVLTCVINPRYCFWHLFRKGEPSALYSMQSLAPLTISEEQRMTKWKRQVAFVGGLLFVVPGALAEIVGLALGGFVVGYLMSVLFLDWFLLLSEQQAVKIISSRTAKQVNDKQWDRKMQQIMKVS